MITSHLIGVFYALSSALVFGASDFCGGMASRRINQYQVLVISSFVSIFVMAALALVWKEDLPSISGVLWGSLGGAAGVLGLVALYGGLASGNAAIVSPVSGVVSASLPVIFAILTKGLPGISQLAGFAIALPGIWLVTLTTPTERDKSTRGVVLGILAGVGFGFFFIFVSRVEKEGVFIPLAIAKMSSWLVAFMLLTVKKHKVPSIKGNWLAVLTGIIDPIANALFVLANHYTRLDVAAVLSSLYPAGTVFLSRLILKEQISRLQWIGVMLCLVAIVLITM